MKVIIFLLLVSSFSALAWKQEARHLLPAKLSEFKIDTTTSDVAIKKLGKPDLIEGTKYYWKDEGFKYAIELTFKDSKLTSLHYNFPKKPSASSLKLSEEDYKEFKAQKSILKLKSRDVDVSINLPMNVVQSVRLK